MQESLRDLMECPACHSALDWRGEEQRGSQIETGTALCSRCGVTYPIRDGIGQFLTADTRSEDLWEEAATGIGRYLAQHPEADAQLTGGPLEALGPADAVFRAVALQERGDVAGAEAAWKAALPRLYTAEYLACYAAVREYLIGQVASTALPVVDLASGRGDLANALLPALAGPLVLTDISPRVLRDNRRRGLARGSDQRVSMLALDARRTPFKSGALPILTTNFGLGNVHDADRMLAELRRVASGTLYAITYFYPEDDAANRAALEAAGLDALAFRRSALDRFAAAGWRVTLACVRQGYAEPTPAGVVLEGATVDGLPVAPTVVEWCVLVAR
jgi:uncharacterized protein YbaR (Trm112 family)